MPDPTLIGWYLIPYVVGFRADGSPYRYVAIDALTTQIWNDNGYAVNDGTQGPFWAESEVLGNVAVVKVRASAATHAEIAALPGAFQFPGVNLTDPLTPLTAQQSLAITSKLESLGYTAQEIFSHLPHVLNTYELGALLAVVALRRLQPSGWDPVGQQFVLDGPVQPVVPITALDAAVQ